MAMIALVVMSLALFRDRSRGRRRCPKCWYDMPGGNGMTCPECGRTQKREKGFAKTRRRWRGVVLGMLLLAGSVGTVLAPAASTGEWVKHTPTPVLRGILAWFPQDAKKARTKFESSLIVSSLTRWERTLLASEYARVVRTARIRTETEAIDQEAVMACFMLGMLGEDARVALPELRAGLQRDDLLYVFATVHVTLGAIAQDNAEAVADALRREEEPSMRALLIEALYAVGGRSRETGQAMRGEFEASTSDAQRFEAVSTWIMVDAEDPAIVDALVKIMTTGSAIVRVIAIRLLGVLAHSAEASHVRLEGQMECTDRLLSGKSQRRFPSGRPIGRAVPPIKDALEDKDAEVRRHAEDVLRGIPGASER
jgi:hypothetical protein